MSKLKIRNLVIRDPKSELERHNTWKQTLENEESDKRSSILSGIRRGFLKDPLKCREVLRESFGTLPDEESSRFKGKSPETHRERYMKMNRYKTEISTESNILAKHSDYIPLESLLKIGGKKQLPPSLSRAKQVNISLR
jgi:hypothetical protein